MSTTYAGNRKFEEPKKVITSIRLVTEGDTNDEISFVIFSSKLFSCSITISSVMATKTKSVITNNSKAKINLEVIHPAFLEVVDGVIMLKIIIHKAEEVAFMRSNCIPVKILFQLQFKLNTFLLLYPRYTTTSFYVPFRLMMIPYAILKLFPC